MKCITINNDIIPLFILLTIKKYRWLEINLFRFLIKRNKHYIFNINISISID